MAGATVTPNKPGREGRGVAGVRRLIGAPTVRPDASSVDGLSLALAPQPHAAASAREYVRVFCRMPGLGEVCESAVLVVSELVSNALRHADTPMVLLLRIDGPMLRMEVADRSPMFVRPHRAELLRENGRGLAIVAALAARWGVDLTDSGKSVWAELAI
ncbi:MAG TPA: ATP-binding protein [Mycobacteriales bacterium]|nr:ATP-binding protein [Mycobacteriales bacterium]